MLARLAELVEVATAAFDDFDYARALERTETFFWSFTDDYIELVKNRAYGSRGDERAASAHAALARALDTLLRLFAPFLPFTAEEVWSWWREGSVHQAKWPESAALRADAGDADPALLGVAAEVLSELRRVKTEAKRSLRTPLTSATVADTPTRLALVADVLDDLADAGVVAGPLTTIDGAELAVTAELADEGSADAGAVSSAR
jgi:valyl-tRNA synthetase